MHAMDKAGLVLAGNSYAAKRAHHGRWMHSAVRSMMQFDGFVNEAQLCAIRGLAEAWGLTAPGMQTGARLLERVDFIAWKEDVRHNCEHMLEEAPGLQALAGVWALLRSSALLNHHLLRCCVVSVDAPGQWRMRLEQQRPGAYLACLALEGAEATGGEPAVEMLVEGAGAGEPLRLPLAQARVHIVPADLPCRFVVPVGATPPRALVFLSMAAVQ